MTSTVKHRILIAICIVITAAAFFSPRIAQDQAYHRFADKNNFLMIPNAFNVLTNLFFAWVGCEGLYRLLAQKSLLILDQIFPVYLLFLVALILIAVGSGYYHWSPDNQTLLWDRMPMTLAFMSFFTILLAERVSIGLAKNLFALLVIAGLASIIYWHYSELAGRGDLRPYVLIQFLPILLTPFILLMFASRYTRSSDIWWFLAWYLIAKLCEAFDRQIYDALIILSGHSLKHISASIGCLVFLRHLRFRYALPP